MPRPHRAGAATARSVQHAIARIDRKLQEDEHEKNTLGGGLTHSAGGGKEKGEAEEESEMRKGEREAAERIADALRNPAHRSVCRSSWEGGSHEHEAGRRGNPL